MSSRRSCWPTGNDVFGVGIGEAIGSGIVREVRDHDDGILAWHAAPPDEDALVVVEVDMEEIGIVHRQSRMTCPEVNQARDVLKDVISQRFRTPRKVDRIDFLTARI